MNQYYPVFASERAFLWTGPKKKQDRTRRKEKNQKYGGWRWLIFSCHFSHLPLPLPPPTLVPKRLAGKNVLTFYDRPFKVTPIQFYAIHLPRAFDTTFHYSFFFLEKNLISRWRRRDQLVLTRSSKNKTTVVCAIGKNPGYGVQQLLFSLWIEYSHWFKYLHKVVGTNQSEYCWTRPRATLLSAKVISISLKTQKMEKTVWFVLKEQYQGN